MYELFFDLEFIHCDRWLQVPCRLLLYRTAREVQQFGSTKLLLQRGLVLQKGFVPESKVCRTRTMSSLSSPPESLLKPINVPQKTLLGPGPSSAPPRVLAAGALPLLGHLHAEFTQVRTLSVRYGIESYNLSFVNLWDPSKQICNPCMCCEDYTRSQMPHMGLQNCPCSFGFCMIFQYTYPISNIIY